MAHTAGSPTPAYSGISREDALTKIYHKPGGGKANQRIPASWEVREKAFEKKMDAKLGRTRVNGKVVRQA